MALANHICLMLDQMVDDGIKRVEVKTYPTSTGHVVAINSGLMECLHSSLVVDAHAAGQMQTDIVNYLSTKNVVIVTDPEVWEFINGLHELVPGVFTTHESVHVIDGEGEVCMWESTEWEDPDAVLAMVTAVALSAKYGPAHVRTFLEEQSLHQVDTSDE
mgnify:CR=1 FL=1